MRTPLVVLLCLAALPALAIEHHLLIASGIGGDEAYSQQFTRHALQLRDAALAAGIVRERITWLDATPHAEADGRSDKAAIEAAIAAIGARAGADDRVFIVLIGHGNARGDGAVFNLPGPDIEAAEFDAALAALPTQTLTLVNTASASGPFIAALAGPKRIVISATASAREYHAPRFGEHFVAAFTDAIADRDKDERVSMLEAFDYARREVRREFEADKRILTEHALLDDNGDGDGSGAPGETGADGALARRVHLQPPPRAADLPPPLAAKFARKHELETGIDALKRRRDDLPAANYYAELERLLVELALLARDIRAAED